MSCTFAHDNQKYARLVPFYRAKMTGLDITDADTNSFRVIILQS